RGHRARCQPGWQSLALRGGRRVPPARGGAAVPAPVHGGQPLIRDVSQSATRPPPEEAGALFVSALFVPALSAVRLGAGRSRGRSLPTAPAARARHDQLALTISSP